MQEIDYLFSIGLQDNCLKYPKEFDYIFKCWCILNPRYYYAIEKTMQTSNLC